MAATGVSDNGPVMWQLSDCDGLYGESQLDGVPIGVATVLWRHLWARVKPRLSYADLEVLFRFFATKEAHNEFISTYVGSLGSSTSTFKVIDSLVDGLSVEFRAIAAKKNKTDQARVCRVLLLEQCHHIAIPEHLLSGDENFLHVYLAVTEGAETDEDIRVKEREMARTYSTAVWIEASIVRIYKTQYNSYMSLDAFYEPYRAMTQLYARFLCNKLFSRQMSQSDREDLREVSHLYEDACADTTVRELSEVRRDYFDAISSGLVDNLHPLQRRFADIVARSAEAVVFAFKNADSATVDPKSAYRKCLASLDDICANVRSNFGDDTAFVDLLEDQRSRDSLRSYLQQACHDCFTAADEREQLVNLRRKIVACADETAIAEAYTSLPDSDRNILSDRMFTKRDKRENDGHFTRTRAFNKAATIVLRYLSQECFKDTRPGDWFEGYTAITQLVHEERLRTVLSESKAEASLTARLLPTLERRRQEILEVAFSGGNYEFDPPSPSPVEPEPVVEEEKEHKRASIYSDEIDKIVDILWSRFRAISVRKVYVLDEFEPKDWYRCLVVDVALIWTILAVKLEIPPRGQRYINEIAGRVLERSGVETSGNDKLEALLARAKAFVDLNLEMASYGEPWFANHMIQSFSFVYDVAVDRSPAKVEQRRALGRMAAGLGPHIWPLFADVSNVFGDNLTRKWIEDAD